jgi:regulator of replication initiation timing
MTKTEELIDLLNNDIIPEIEDVIDGLFELINDAKTATDEVKQELHELQELKTEFKVMLEEAMTGELEEDEAQEIIEEIEEMRAEGEEEA